MLVRAEVQRDHPVHFTIALQKIDEHNTKMQIFDHLLADWQFELLVIFRSIKYEDFLRFSITDQQECHRVEVLLQ